jgi:16S rRNA G966 N2-methylase RsmD
MAKVIQANLHVTGLESRGAVHTGDISRVVPALQRDITLVLADPPYEDADAWSTMTTVATAKIVDAAAATIAVEHSSRGDAPASLGQFRLRKTIKHGDGAVAIYVASDDN